MRIKSLLISAGLAAALVVSILPSAASKLPQSQTVKWRIVRSPDRGPQPAGNTLLAVADVSSTDAWAVGC